MTLACDRLWRNFAASLEYLPTKPNLVFFVFSSKKLVRDTLTSHLSVKAWPLENVIHNGCCTREEYQFFRGAFCMQENGQNEGAVCSDEHIAIKE